MGWRVWEGVEEQEVTEESDSKEGSGTNEVRRWSGRRCAKQDTRTCDKIWDIADEGEKGRGIRARGRGGGGDRIRN